MSDTEAAEDSLAPDTSLRDAITAAFDEQGTEPAGEGAAPDPVAPSAEASPSVERPGVERPRGPDGKFIEKAAAEVAKPEPKIDPKANGQADPAKAAQPAAGAVPETLSPADRAAFAKLSPEGQTFVAQREQRWNEALTAKGREAATLQRKLADYDDVVAPYQAELAQHGMTPAAAFRQLIGLRDFARKDPAGYIKWFAEGHKIDPATILGAPKADEYVDPQIKALNDRIAQFEGHVSSQRQAEETRIVSGIVSAMEAFKGEKGADGQPAHPYFDQLEAEMTVITNAIRAKFPNAAHADVLKVAYDRAVWMNPQTRQATMTAREQAAEAKRLKDAQAHAAQARRASSPVRGAPGPGSGISKPIPSDDLRENISQAYDAQMNGGARA